MVFGTRFALEPGRGHSSVPVRPALAGTIVGVLGVLAAFTFSAGVSDAAALPARFGQTNQLERFLGLDGRDFALVGPALRAVARDHDVTGVNYAGLQSFTPVTRPSRPTPITRSAANGYPSCSPPADARGR